MTEDPTGDSTPDDPGRAVPPGRAARVRDEARRWLAEIETQREQMVRTLQVHGQAPSDAIAHAMRVVPRQAWIPTAEIHEIYDPALTHVIDYDEQGQPLGSVTAPWLQARMLDQAALRPGMRVLEIGSGGPGAALIATIVGRRGLVVSLDIDHAVLDRTFRGLIAAGFDDVVVLDGDGWHGAPAYAPFDRIIVTAATTDIAPSWIDQLTPDGRLVVPLRVLSTTRSLALDRDGDRLHGDDSAVCHFLPLRGTLAAAAMPEPAHRLGDHLLLRTDGAETVDVAALTLAVDTDGVQEWSGVEIGDGDEADDYLPLTLADARVGVLVAVGHHGAPDHEADAESRAGVPCLVDADSLAFRIQRRSRHHPGHRELGVVAQGPRREEVAGRLLDLLQSWDRERRAHPQPHVEIRPAQTPDADLPAGRVIETHHHRIVVSWPGRIGQA